MSDTAWIPILTSSGLKADACAAVEAVTRAVVEGDYTDPDGRGHGGEEEALLYAYLAAARSDLSRATQATERLNAVIDEAAEQSRHAGLYGGLCGLGWTVEHVSRLLAGAFPDPPTDEPETPDDGSGEEDGDLVADIDAAILKELRRVPAGGWRGDYDLIRGLVGFGAYFLERWPAEAAQVGLRLVLDHLEASADRRNSGVTWFTIPDLLPQFQRDRYPKGYYNLGVAHGVPGVIHFLGEVAALGVEGQRVEPLLAGGVDWLLARRRPPGSASWFGSFFSPGVDADDSRLAWCYGDLGIVAVLFQVARRARREDWHRFACDLLDHCLAKSPETSWVVDTLSGRRAGLVRAGTLVATTRRPSGRVPVDDETDTGGSTRLGTPSGLSGRGHRRGPGSAERADADRAELGSAHAPVRTRLGDDVVNVEARSVRPPSG
jgi:hypothetical protein